MQLIETILALVVTLGILVTVHEFGHFLVARWCGVKVLRFSVGFGKPFFSRYDRRGTEFAVAAIPLGGYVKMLDEREGEVPPDELDQAFNRKSPGRRIAIASAGPIANFIFALLAYWLLNVIGFSSVAPVIGEVEPESPAASMGLEAGMEILAIDGQAVSSWRQVGVALIQRAGEQGTIRFAVSEDGSRSLHETALEGWLAGARDPDPVRMFGIQPWRPPVPAIIDSVMAGEPAARAGLQPGDHVLAVNDEPIADWTAFVESVRAAPEQTLHVMVERAGEERTLTITPGSRETPSGDTIGTIGAGAQPIEWPEELLRTTRFGPVAAVPEAFEQFWSDTRLTLVAVQKMVTGLLSLHNLSGPITIARVAEATASSGFEDFVRFLAYLSITLGILNLLPIPVLDGGHIVFYGIEALRGKPLSERVQGLGLRIGLGLILALMFVALYNDLMRL